MNVGKTLFAQVMEFVPWKTFGRIIDRHGGDAGVRTLGCADLFRIMSFAQLTWRESPRDIEVCLTANRGKLFHMGLKNIPARSTLSDALNLRDWRIYQELAMRLIGRARTLYASGSLDIDLEATVYALDSTTIDLCLSLFDWAPFRSTKAAVKMHTLLDLRGAIPAFIHVSDGKMHDVGVLVLRYGSRLSRLRATVQTPSGGGFLRYARQTEHECASGLPGCHRSQSRRHLRPGHRLERLLRFAKLSRTLAPRSLQGPKVRKDPWRNLWVVKVKGRHWTTTQEAGFAWS